MTRLLSVMVLIGLAGSVAAEYGESPETSLTDEKIVLFELREVEQARGRVSPITRYTIRRDWLDELSVDPLGPSITVEKPDADLNELSSPIELELAWNPTEDASVELTTFDVRYEESATGALVSGRDRLMRCRSVLARSFCRLDRSGLWVRRADVPAGDYRFYVFIADDLGRGSLATFDVSIVN